MVFSCRLSSNWGKQGDAFCLLEQWSTLLSIFSIFDWRSEFASSFASCWYRCPTMVSSIMMMPLYKTFFFFPLISWRPLPYLPLNCSGDATQLGQPPASLPLPKENIEGQNSHQQEVGNAPNPVTCESRMALKDWEANKQVLHTQSPSQEMGWEYLV